MTSLKAADVAPFARKPDPRNRAFLVFGPDQGLVSEISGQLAGKLLGPDHDPFSLVKLDADNLSGDPGRLVDEVSTISMFGGGRLVWVRAIASRIDPRTLTAAIEPVLSLANGGYLLVEAGDLKENSPLRKLFTSSSAAVALPCYADGANDLLRLIDEEMRQAGLAITATARSELASHLGGDRIATRQELRKLALYCHGKSSVDEHDVAAICGDVSTLAIDALIDTMALGQHGELASIYARMLAENHDPTMLVGAALRHMLWIALACAEMERGKSATSVRDNARPRIHFKRVKAIDRQLSIWTTAKATRAYRMLAEDDLDVRKRYHLAEVLGERALLRVAALIA